MNGIRACRWRAPKSNRPRPPPTPLEPLYTGTRESPKALAFRGLWSMQFGVCTYVYLEHNIIYLLASNHMNALKAHTIKVGYAIYRQLTRGWRKMAGSVGRHTAAQSFELKNRRHKNNGILYKRKRTSKATQRKATIPAINRPKINRIRIMYGLYMLS